MCIEKVVIRKSGEEMYSKTYQSPMAPQRVVLKPNFNYERQDTTTSDARMSFDHSDTYGGTYRETCRGQKDFRIQGLLHSAVQKHGHIRKAGVKKLIHQFETHPNREALKADLKQNHALSIQREGVGHDSQHGNTEYFEMCGIISPKYSATNV